MPFVFNAVRLGGPGVPLAPNATRQALEIAGAKNEHRLFPVACTRLLGAVVVDSDPFVLLCLQIGKKALPPQELHRILDGLNRYLG